MINTDKLEKMSYDNKVVSMYEELNVDLVKDILKRIKKEGDITSFTKAQIKVLKRRGGSEMFKKALIETNSLSVRRKKELLKIIESVVKNDIKDNKDLYEYRDMNFELSTSQLRILKQMTNLTDKELQNYTRTIAFSTRKEFVDAVDKMYQQVVTGGIDYLTAFKETSNELAKKGITLPMKNGKNRSIEAAVRQNTLYGIRRTSQLINDDLIEYLGADGVEINITPNCRPDHRVINGQIFSLDRNNRKYPYFKKKYQALMEDYGCQHYKSPFIIGVSEPVYTQKEVKKANSRAVNYKGKQIPYYEATQKQRALEREIRYAKREYMINPNVETKEEINKANKNLRNFINETGLERDRQREYFAGYNK